MIGRIITPKPDDFLLYSLLMPKEKLAVAVIFGSRSTEHDVSIITAISSVIKPLELSGRYNVYPVYIDKQGRWFSDPMLSSIDLYTKGNLDQLLSRLKPLQLNMNGSFELVWSGLRPKSVKIDVAFPATHGTHGEDGELMGLLEMANVAYVGCDLPSSAIAMDKALCKTIALSEGILTPKYVWFYPRDFNRDNDAILSQLSALKYPLFVKPVHLGSSIAIARVINPKELINAIEVAAHYDDKVLVEEAVNNLIEVTVPIIGNDKLRPAFVEQPLFKSQDFFDFNSKYLHGGKKTGGSKNGSQGYSKLPADLPPKLYREAEAIALAVYKVIGCSGIARVDLLIDSKTKKVYFNEVNPLPGSLYAHNWRAKGLSNVKLVDELINLALERSRSKR
ncbi:D-alanine--D-alanine ligase [Patescibacteria group bacterium]|nr:D-alanine--D-alanine ligase [Patescibacteria group bacterium]